MNNLTYVWIQIIGIVFVIFLLIFLIVNWKSVVKYVLKQWKSKPLRPPEGDLAKIVLGIKELPLEEQLYCIEVLLGGGCSVVISCSGGQYCIESIVSASNSDNKLVISEES